MNQTMEREVFEWIEKAEREPFRSLEVPPSSWHSRRAVTEVGLNPSQPLQEQPLSHLPWPVPQKAFSSALSSCLSHTYDMGINRYKVFCFAVLKWCVCVDFGFLAGMKQKPCLQN